MPPLIPESSIIYGDSVYTIYAIEDMLKETENIALLLARKSNSRRMHEPLIECLISVMRKRIEIAFIEISNFLPKMIHAVKEFGFLLKFVFFLICNFKNHFISSNLN
jgi:hypothetical protein